MRNAFGGLSYRNPHAYQIAFYAHALGCPGILVYPRAERDVNADFEVAGRAFSFLAVDLSTPGLDGLERLAQVVGERLA